MKTLLDILNESKADDEYNKSWSMINREIFDKIALADPKSAAENGELKSIGFVAKQFLLPKYKDGDVEFINNIDNVRTAVIKYQLNPGQYAKLNAFKTVEEFVTYMDNPDAASVDNPVVKEVDAITKIYNEYYKDIPREDFDKIIAMDPKTSATGIGEIAKNILLISYRKKENILDMTQEIFSACKEYYDNKDKLPAEKQQLSTYKSTREFVDYMMSGPESSLVAALKVDETIDPNTKRMVKDDFRLVGSTFDYDIIEPKSHRASVAVSGGYNTSNGMRWCTGWEPDRSGEQDSYWRQYTADGGRLFCFMNKKRYRGTNNRTVNWQIQVRDNIVREFLNGDDNPDYPGDSKNERFKNFLYAHVDIFKAIKDKEPFNALALIKELYAELKYASEPFIVNNMKDVALLETSNISKVCKEVVFSIPVVPAGICASFLSLTSVIFKDGVKEIGGQAFMNCPTLKTIIFPESLEIIGKESFQNCLELQGAIRIPDSVREIRTKAFAQNKCKLKINRSRTTKLMFDKIDKEWISRHVQLITVN